MEQLEAMEANPLVAALDAFTAQGNQLAQEARAQAAQQQAAVLNGLRNSFQVVDDPAQLGLDLGLPEGVTISRLFQGTRGPSRQVLVDVRGAGGADLRCLYSSGGMSAAEQRFWLLDKLRQVRLPGRPTSLERIAMLSGPQEIEVTVVDLEPIMQLDRHFSLHYNIVAGRLGHIGSDLPGLERFLCTLPPSITDRLFPFTNNMELMSAS